MSITVDTRRFWAVHVVLPGRPTTGACDSIHSTRGAAVKRAQWIRDHDSHGWYAETNVLEHSGDELLSLVR